jgi:hypothetical protein
VSVPVCTNCSQVRVPRKPVPVDVFPRPHLVDELGLAVPLLLRVQRGHRKGGHLDAHRGVHPREQDLGEAGVGQEAALHLRPAPRLHHRHRARAAVAVGLGDEAQGQRLGGRRVHQADLGEREEAAGVGGTR